MENDIKYNDNIPLINDFESLNNYFKEEVVNIVNYLNTLKIDINE